MLLRAVVARLLGRNPWPTGPNVLAPNLVTVASKW